MDDFFRARFFTKNVVFTLKRPALKQFRVSTTFLKLFHYMIPPAWEIENEPVSNIYNLTFSLFDVYL